MQFVKKNHQQRIKKIEYSILGILFLNFARCTHFLSKYLLTVQHTSYLSMGYPYFPHDDSLWTRIFRCLLPMPIAHPVVSCLHHSFCGGSAFLTHFLMFFASFQHFRTTQLCQLLPALFLILLHRISCIFLHLVNLAYTLWAWHTDVFINLLFLMNMLL